MTSTLHVEHQILAICMTVPGSIGEVAAIIHKADTFSTEQNQRVYKVMQELYAQSYETDLVTVYNDLQRQYGDLDEDPTGWMDFLTSLIPEADYVTFNLSKSCFWLIGEATRRSLSKVYSKALSELQIPGSDPLILLSKIMGQEERIMGRLSELSEVPFASALREAMELAAQAAQQKNPITGIPSGLPELDLYLKGFHGATMSIFAARTAMGKTAQLCQMSYNTAVEQKIPTAVFEMEMKRVQLARRYIAIASEIKNSEVLSGLDKWGNEINFDKMFNMAGKIADRPLFVFDSIFELDQLCAKITQLVVSHGVKIVFIDYVGLVETGDKEDRVRIGRTSRRLKNLANKLNIPIIILAQLSREVEKRKDKRPQLSDLRDSGSLEQDADNVVFLYRPGYYEAKDESGADIDPNLLYNIIAKNRNGSTHNDREGIALHYDLSTNRIRPYNSPSPNQF